MIENLSKYGSLRADFQSGLLRLEEVLRMEKNSVVRDSAIQRFEFTLDLAWKTVKAYLEEQKGVVCRSPKDCLRQAFSQGLIEYDDFWLAMVDLRNETAHIYKEETAEAVYAKLPACLEKFQQLRKKLENQKVLRLDEDSAKEL